MDLRGRSARRIEKHLKPIQDEKFAGDRAGVVAGFQIIERNFDLLDSRRNVEVKRENIQRVALPGNGLAVRGDFQAGEVVNRADGGVRALNPLRVIEGSTGRAQPA